MHPSFEFSKISLQYILTFLVELTENFVAFLLIIMIIINQMIDLYLKYNCALLDGGLTDSDKKLPSKITPLVMSFQILIFRSVHHIAGCVKKATSELHCG